MADWNKERAEAIIAAHRKVEGATIPILHALQDEFGYVPEEAVPLVASALNLSRAEVHGVVTFYHDFHDTPRGAHVLKLCGAEACQSMGAELLAEAAKKNLQLGWGETAPDHSITLERVFCLGLCACAPAAMLDGKVHGALNEQKLTTLLDQVRHK
jgi:formate dehydrogenase subunit gamma